MYCTEWKQNRGFIVIQEFVDLLSGLPMSCWIVVAALFMYHDGALP